MWELDYEESWVPKNWCFWTVVLEKTLESPLDCKEIKPVHPKGNQSWIFVGRTDAEAEAPILWPPDVKNWLIEKAHDARKDWRWEGKGTTEDEMVECHHRHDGHEFEQALGVGEGQGSLGAAVHEIRVKSRTWLSDWTEPNLYNVNIYLHFSDHWLERGSFHLYTGHLFFSKLCYLPSPPPAFFLPSYLFRSL